MYQVAVLSLLAGASVACGHLHPFGLAEDATGWFDDQFSEYALQPLKLASGTIPSWINGGLVRVGPGFFTTKGRNLTHLFDGPALVHKFALANGSAAFSSRFLRTDFYNKSMAASKFCKSSTIGAVQPPFGMFDKTCKTDNTNVNVWRVDSTSDQLLALTDAAVVNAFNGNTLDFDGPVQFDDVLDKAKTSAAHPQTSVSGEFVDFAVSVNVKLPPTYNLTVFKMGADYVRRPFGQIKLDVLPYMHSFAQTEHYTVIVQFPLSINALDIMMGKPLKEAFKWNATGTTIAHVFEVNSTDPNALPVAQFELPAFFTFHHANAYEKDGKLILDMASYDSFVLIGKHAFGDLDVVRNATARKEASPVIKFRRAVLDMHTGQGSVSVLPVLDSSGAPYDFDFPRVNPAVSSKAHCFIYGVANNAGGKGNWDNSAIVKADVCSKPGQVLVTPWEVPGLYPSEPSFVASPGAAAEDDGVLLVMVYDALAKGSRLAVLDAVTMKEVGLTSPAPHVPYDFHGSFFEGLH